MNTKNLQERSLPLILAIAGVLSIYGTTSALTNQPLSNIDAAQEFNIIVYENSDSTLLTMGKNVSSRGILGDSWKTIKNAYRNTLVGQISSVSSDILTTGVGLLVEALRDKKGDWMQQVKRDCSYTRVLPMQRQITDFYASTSTRGAMDLDSIVFDGFGCQQFLTFRDPQTDSLKRMLVFDLKCALRKDQPGLDRMLHHSKFEVTVDHLFFNPYLCNLPNDSLTAANADLRIPFSFDSRSNLSFNVDARLTSSWLNEAIQAVNDQLLGEFSISAQIKDETVIEKGDWYPGYFVYIDPTPENIRLYNLNSEQIERMKQNAKHVSVTGESFLVPRSFVGYDNTRNHNRIWGTGQYKVEMTITEKCDINYDHYLYPAKDKGMARDGNAKAAKPGNMSGRKWNDNWSHEWRRMKKRRHSPNVFQSILSSMNMNYGNFRWVNTILDPVTAVILEQENAALRSWTDSWMKLGAATAAGKSPASASTPQTQSQQGQNGSAQPKRN